MPVVGVDCLLRPRPPRRSAVRDLPLPDNDLKRELENEGRLAFEALVRSHFLPAGTRVNEAALGIASRGQVNVAQLCREAELDYSSIKQAVAVWRKRLTEAGPLKPGQAAGRVLRSKDDWVLGSEPTEHHLAAHHRPSSRGRCARAARAFSTPAVTMAKLRPLLSAHGVTVRADGAEQTAEALACGWSYISVHLCTLTAAGPLMDEALSTWSFPPWLRPARNERESESLLAIFLTVGSPATCSLHKDAVDSAWLVTSGTRDLWVLPPWAERAALIDVQHQTGTYDSTFSEYQVWNDDNRHPAWRRVALQSGDWVYMPRGWWHIAASSAESVMLNFRVER